MEFTRPFWRDPPPSREISGAGNRATATLSRESLQGVRYPKTLELLFHDRSRALVTLFRIGDQFLHFLLKSHLHFFIL